MTKHALIIDLKGALLKPRPFDIAHKEWFRIMAELIKDYSINEFSFLPDYFVHVQEIMKKYLGDIDIKSRNAFARNIYAMAVVESIKKWDVVDDFAEFLRSIKKKYVIVLITTAPTAAVNGILEKTNCKDLFDLIIAGPMEDMPSKKELIELFIKKHAKPLFYIGHGDKDIVTCKELGIKTISVNWVEQGEFKGNFEANKVEDLKNILERFVIE
ncbi:TPA: HAD hydrolase-like protein [Candidatus Woesearchaeota archaeon]|nr:HAD hydrolase-like protein [Candidatus Woesearchaeota archaeon]HIH32132.1 HAD hydrolase-like protein [Candidatus Woesearchaeota archaeon]HIH54206.1 HAD hydrolase-like protein [Candidatus Woesearchaeota archaeon]HIJ01272.1 HAD hydrolase-like protein [Candidatus Woesearchaeota archaeon]HIJ13541.1 HAD hydrolase-like protein [Candidatus Woesearchaeota archaeon]